MSGGQQEIPVRASEGTDETNERPVNDVNERTRNAQMEGARMFADYITPTTEGYGSAVVRSPLTVNSFELKASTIGLIRDSAQFSGLPYEDSNQHLTNFLLLCDTVKISGVSGDKIKRRLFPFSLRDHARSWLQSQPKDSFATWEDLAKAFSKKYFPPSKIANCRHDILSFTQLDYESLYEAWERYKDLMR